MIDELKIFRGNDIVINDKISVHIPSLNEICELGEERYYSAVYTICSTPYDYMLFLHDKINVDYTKISDFQMFSLIYKTIDKDVVSLLLCGFNFDNTEIILNEDGGDIVLYDSTNHMIIDSTLYMLIVGYIRKIHMLERKNDIPASEDSYNYLLEKERRKLRYNRKTKFESVLAPLISSMVNTCDFKYNHTDVWELPIYTFMDSVRRISKKEAVGYTLQGIYTGSIDSKKISNDAMNWMSKIN